MADLKNGKYGVLEVNQLAARYTAQIEATCKLNATDFATTPAENGMLLVVDKAAGEIKKATNPQTQRVLLHYSAEKIYDAYTPGLNNFAVQADAFGVFPRLFELNLGDVFTTNTVEDGVGANGVLVANLVGRNLATDKVFAIASITGNIQLVKEAGIGTAPIVLQAIKYTTVPDGVTPGVKFTVIRA